MGAFAELPRLQWLDLSNNRLGSLDPQTFEGSSLHHLFLNGNRGIRLGPDSFSGLGTAGLYLHDCGLDGVRAEVLSPIADSRR